MGAMGTTGITNDTLSVGCRLSSSIVVVDCRLLLDNAVEQSRLVCITSTGDNNAVYHSLRNGFKRELGS